MTETGPADVRLVDLGREERERGVPVIVDAFSGVYRWHAKRTLRSVATVRAAELGGEVVGVALLERLEPEVGYVYYVAVRKDHRRGGIGGALLDDALAGFRRAGAEVVFAAVRAENAASLRLFASRGFRPTEKKEKSYRDGGLGAWGLRSRMWVVSGEELLGLRLAPLGRAEGVPALGEDHGPRRAPNG